MRKKKIIIGNWKMNPLTYKEAEKLFSAVVRGVTAIKSTEVVICAPFPYLSKLKKKSKKVSLGAQNAFAGEVGAFTGEVSPNMLENIGVKYVILGHSERRNLGETNLDVNKKIKSALRAGLVPILCVGESIHDENHDYFNFIKTQVIECLNGVSKNSISKIIIAYEPVWALSTTLNRKDATPRDAEEMAIFIRKIVSDKFGLEASKMRILYGGSANEKDAEDFLTNGGVDGLLAGRASLNAGKFIQMVKIADGIK